MADEMITSDNLSVDMLKAIFEAAYMDVSLDEDGDLLVKEACKVFVQPDLEHKNRIRMFTIFTFEDSSSKSDRLECVNRINREYVMVCAFTTDTGALVFRYDLVLAGGLPRKALVVAVKRFASIPHSAVQEHGASLVK